MKKIPRCQMNQLMAIPEVQQIIEAKFVELRLIFKDKLNQVPESEQNPVESKASNLIRFPLLLKNPDEKSLLISETDDNIDVTKEDDSISTAIKIVDTSSYRYIPEEEQVKIFMDYFKNHRLLRQAILDEFFQRILPYSNIMVK